MHNDDVSIPEGVSRNWIGARRLSQGPFHTSTTRGCKRCYKRIVNCKVEMTDHLEAILLCGSD